MLMMFLGSNESHVSHINNPGFARALQSPKRALWDPWVIPLLWSGAGVGVGMLRGARDLLENTKVTQFPFHVF